MIQGILDNLLKEHSDVLAAIVGTSDGYLKFQSARDGFSSARLATIGASFIALGDAMTNEAKMGNCRNLISENEHGIVVVLHITTDMFLMLFSENKSLLGFLLATGRNVVGQINNSSS